MYVHEKINARRQELGLNDMEVSERIGLSIYEYGDVEQHSDEIFLVTELRYVKKLCKLLNFDFFELFDKRCTFCGKTHHYSDEFILPRNKLIHKKREEMGLSAEALGDQIGFEEWLINDMEADPDFLEKWPLKYIKNLSNMINIPFQILLSIKCKKCGR
jgi:DNA-binding XRE family transcriptional regulator